jgi:hypothetical protein
MYIGKPIRIMVVEPLRSPVPREKDRPPPQPGTTRDAPARTVVGAPS